MEQILATKLRQTAIIQDVLASNKKFEMNSSANSAKCTICGKGIEDGFSITAKSIHKGIVFFCETHYQ